LCKRKILLYNNILILLIFYYKKEHIKKEFLLVKQKLLFYSGLVALPRLNHPNWKIFSRFLARPLRTVIVTGAAQGIGYAIAQSFINNGDFVAILDLNLEAAESAAKELGNAKGYKVNVADEEMVKSAIEQIIADRGTIDVLVNNAGLQHIAKVEDFPLDPPYLRQTMDETVT
jgi:hypothetical protein